MTDSVDPDQVLHSVASDLGLYCLLRPTSDNYSTCIYLQARNSLDLSVLDYEKMMSKLSKIHK